MLGAAGGGGTSTGCPLPGVEATTSTVPALCPGGPPRRAPSEQTTAGVAKERQSVCEGAPCGETPAQPWTLEQAHPPASGQQRVQVAYHPYHEILSMTARGVTCYSLVSEVAMLTPFQA